MRTRELKPIYLDHNATTVMEQSAERALLLSLSTFGNPSSIHSAGRKAKAAVDQARDELAEALGVSDAEQILFTSSATEAINTALKGVFALAQEEGKTPTFLTSAVEHEAVLETVKFVAAKGAKSEILKVNSQGELALSELEESLRKASAAGGLILVSLMAANNETGVIFPWREAAALAKKYGALFHLDGVQALGKIPDFTLPDTVDFASFSGHKIGALKGIGALVVRKGARLTALLHGGAQERKRRAGTLNVSGILTFGAAAAALKGRDYAKVAELRNHLEKSVRTLIPGVEFQGEKAERLGNTSNMLFEGVRGESLVVGLDLEGFAVSSGSACNSGSILPSHVLLAMGFDKVAAQSALRVSLSPTTTREEVDLFTAALGRVVERIRVKNNAKLSSSPAALKY